MINSGIFLIIGQSSGRSVSDPDYWLERDFPEANHWKVISLKTCHFPGKCWGLEQNNIIPIKFQTPLDLFCFILGLYTRADLTVSHQDRMKTVAGFESRGEEEEMAGRKSRAERGGEERGGSPCLPQTGVSRLSVTAKEAEDSGQSESLHSGARTQHRPEESRRERTALWWKPSQEGQKERKGQAKTGRGRTGRKDPVSMVELSRLKMETFSVYLTVPSPPGRQGRRLINNVTVYFRKLLETNLSVEIIFHFDK